MPRTIVQLQLLMAFQKMMNFNLRLKCWIFLKPRLVSLNDCLRNDCVFNGAAPSIPVALARAREEAHLWSLAGAKGLPLDTASAVVS